MSVASAALWRERAEARTNALRAAAFFSALFMFADCGILLCRNKPAFEKRLLPPPVFRRRAQWSRFGLASSLRNYWLFFAA
ncbi:MAG: hypothetical protein DBX55_04330 [Verrucomicrobia bacterium]|nr:MAG: hypothetical protein DBX55_04330 [Verrucomicrobiota bacterium]